MSQRTTKPHRATYTDPLTAKAGERLSVEERESEWPGWVWATAPSGQSGWVPRAYLTPLEGAAILQRDYSAQELTVAAGIDVVVLRAESGWVWVRDPEGCEGWIPANVLSG